MNAQMVKTVTFNRNSISNRLKAFLTLFGYFHNRSYKVITL